MSVRTAKEGGSSGVYRWLCGIGALVCLFLMAVGLREGDKFLVGLGLALGIPMFSFAMRGHRSKAATPYVSPVPKWYAWTCILVLLAAITAMIVWLLIQ